MPYVDSKTREMLENGVQAVTVGELTYELQQACRRYLLARGALMQPSFAILGEVTTALEEAKADFRERVVAPYERKKREENGDVW